MVPENPFRPTFAPGWVPVQESGDYVSFMSQNGRRRKFTSYDT